jgi:ribosomal protein S18 acetylase RimI-like enzyme
MSFYKMKVTSENVGMSWSFFVDDTRCENPEHYNSYLRYQALTDQNEGLGVTYLYVEHNEETEVESIMGYITLRVSSFIKDMGESKKFGYPALEIAELAVDKKYAGRHIGTEMVLDAVNIANELNKIVSIKYIVLCSDPTAESFYKKLEFVKMSDTWEEVPREHSNVTCVPMYLKLR